MTGQGHELASISVMASVLHSTAGVLLWGDTSHLSSWPQRGHLNPQNCHPRSQPSGLSGGFGDSFASQSPVCAVKPRCRAFPAAPTGSRGLGVGAQVCSASPEPALASGLPARQLFVPRQGGTCSASQSSVANRHGGAALPRTQWVVSKADSPLSRGRPGVRS